MTLISQLKGVLLGYWLGCLCYDMPLLHPHLFIDELENKAGAIHGF